MFQMALLLGTWLGSAFNLYQYIMALPTCLHEEELLTQWWHGIAIKEINSAFRFRYLLILNQIFPVPIINLDLAGAAVPFGKQVPMHLLPISWEACGNIGACHITTRAFTFCCVQTRPVPAKDWNYLHWFNIAASHWCRSRSITEMTIPVLVDYSLGIWHA